MKLTGSHKTFYAVLFVLFGAATAWAGSDEDLQDLGFLATPESIVSSARSPRPSSKIAENITVITSEQIEALNAHTLAEVLNTVAGVQLEKTRTPGTQNFFSIDGAANAQVQVFIDGIPQNDLAENLTNLGHIPVQNIERVEIIKGAASAAWGSALGGVINIITKNPFDAKPIGGSVFGSIGGNRTSDTHAEVTGTLDRFGYYLSGGYLNSDGLLPHNQVHFGDAYSKFVYELPGNGAITLGAGFRNIRSGIEEVPQKDWRDDANGRYGNYFLNANRRLTEQLAFELYAKISRQDTETRYGSISLLPPWDVQQRNTSRGAGVKLIWGEKDHNLTSGIDYEHDDFRFDFSDPTINEHKTFERYGYYANGALSINKFTFLPGIRFDRTGTNGDFTSYTAGATYRVTDETIVRGYWARGYSLPKIIFPHGPQKVWTIQAGVESSELENLWVKGTFFYNNTSNIEDVITGANTVTNQIRQGFELELRTVPVWNTSFSAAYTFSDIRFEDTGHDVPGLPNQVVKLQAHYNNSSLGLSGVLTGNLVTWYRVEGKTTKDQNPVWDLTLTKKLWSSENAAEIFFSGHNLFDTPQYLDADYKNAGRWFEGGVRCKF
ncbi:TonB-dependent receptor plug domain-containing protein [Geomesophilobacter sediminis]|uniref:TonB-dependent receptor plug domain-containing protein n=1 Tax=Geomesophilobacter sediminis TaxID=2798584 RepID=A0A8J7LUQ3_9BACT|nr:TonB-dependent receptor plug domain-containing protein [Geomesophilobacter sediminis]MBJ6723985.1 TonB-dependent receptor plug domain-containing protein [Geomesophilobacter sediminis]